jgi:hypothetical protein
LELEPGVFRSTGRLKNSVASYNQPDVLPSIRGNGRRGQKAEAAAAVAELLKVRPGFTVQMTEEGSGVSDHPMFRKEFLRIVEGPGGPGQNAKRSTKQALAQ